MHSRALGRIEFDKLQNSPDQQSLAAADDVLPPKRQQVTAASALFPFRLGRVHWSKEASSYFTPCFLFIPGIKPSHWIIRAMVETIIR
jgi:hypothetical protein